MMNLGELAHQYRDTTLPKLIEKQVKSLTEETLLQAVRGTFDNFPVGIRPQLNAFTEDYLKNWFGPHIITTDLGDLFTATIKDIQSMAIQDGISLNDEQMFDVFNIMVMKLSYFAHSRPAFRKQLGIKKGWFS
ncbi:hypothetical protein K8I31_12975 [bacterium]|nr:hypothetical protein [bacterium]